MRKALVLLMTTCILLAGCIEGLTESVEEQILDEEIIPGCNDPNALNYNENDTTDDTCITSDTLYNSIGDFVEMMESESPETSMGIATTISGVDQSMNMGAYTMISTIAANQNTAYSGTDLTISGMTISQSWIVQENGDGTILQASYMGESFLMHSAMSWDDVSSDCHESCSECDDIGEGDCTVCPEGTTMFDEDRDGAGVCVTNDEERDRGDSDSEMTQEDCLERGGNWTEAPDREGQFYCDFGEEDRDDDSEITQEDCEERGGTWHQEDNGDYHCEFDDEDREDSDRDDERGDSDGDMDMDIPDPMEFLSMLDGFDDDCRNDDCGFPENTEFDVGVDGITTTIPTEEGIVKVNFDLVTGEMTGFTMDIYDGSHMTLELLTAEEVNTLLTIDTTLEYEALPFTLEEADAEDEYDVFICDDGEEIPADWENDGMEDCADGSDEDDWGDSVDDDEDPEFTGYWVGYETANWSCNWEDTADPGEDETAYFWSCDDIRDPPEDVGDNDWYYCEYYDDIATHYCTNGFGSQGTDENGEWGNSASFTHWRDGGDPRDVEDDEEDEQRSEDTSTVRIEFAFNKEGDIEFMRYHMYDDEWMTFSFLSDSEIKEVVTATNDGEIAALPFVVESMHDDEDWESNVLHSEHGNEWVIASNLDIAYLPFEGDMNDYKIELSMCSEEGERSEDDSEESPESEEDCSGLMSILISDAMNNDEDDDITFHDNDNSGTLSIGDMISVSGDVEGEWNTVRLYSISADAYSDENPVFEMPGFTGVIGVLALLGAALLRRKA